MAYNKICRALACCLMFFYSFVYCIVKNRLYFIIIYGNADFSFDGRSIVMHISANS